MICGQSYKASTLINYDSRVVGISNLLVNTSLESQFTSKYESRVVIYERKMFIILATGC